MSEDFKSIDCPACGKKMAIINADGIELDICTEGCGGIYFDKKELEHFDEQHENIDAILKALKDKKFAQVDESKTRVCPICGANMVKNFSSVKKEVQIDECYSCGGKFLDYGELEKIRAEFATAEDRGQEALKYVCTELRISMAEFMNKRKDERSIFKKAFDALFSKIDLH